MKKYILSAVVAVGMISVPNAADAAFSDSYQMNSGDVSEDVNELQLTLKELGYFNGSTGHTFGPRTLNAVQDFQADNGISSQAGNFYGVAGPATQEELNNIVSGESNGSSDGSNETTDAGTEEEAGNEEDTGTTEDSTSEDAEGTTYQMEATAYTANCDGCTGVTATGKDLNNDREANVVAVDPDVIPLGSTVQVEGYGEAVAADTGGAINGEKIDLHVPDEEEAINFGRQNVEVTVLD